MLFVYGRLRYLLILTHLLLKIAVGEDEEEVDVISHPTILNAAPHLQELPGDLKKMSKHHPDILSKRIHQAAPPSESANSVASTSRDVNCSERSRIKTNLESAVKRELDTSGITRKQTRLKSDISSQSLGKKDQDGDFTTAGYGGWDLLPAFTNPFGSIETKRKRNPIEDIPILGSLISLGGAVTLAGRRGAGLVADGTRKFGDLAVGTFTKSGFKYPAQIPAAHGFAGAFDGVGGLSGSEVVTVVSALANSKGRTDFVKQLLEKSNPESAFRIGLAAASVAGLKSNPAIGQAAGLLQQFVRKK